MGKLFGTDGIRGIAGKPPLTPGDITALGRAAGQVLRRKTGSKTCRVLAVRDTRASGASILARLALGLRQVGVDVYDAGVLCTPSVAHLVKTRHFQSGVVISASHNPPEFNGIKFFTHLGRKWPDEWENEVEAKFFSGRAHRTSKNPRLTGALVEAGALRIYYEKFIVSTLGGHDDFSGLKIGLDCSNGANSDVAAPVLRQLGATVHVLSVDPNGRNINVGCGSQHPEKLARLVVDKKLQLGIAFDGDGDRVIFVDEKGGVVDGDYVIALLAKHLKKKKLLKNNMVVITVMANLGLKKALHKLGVRSVEVAVGDRYVSEAMRKTGSVLGGEQSGHIIMGRYLPTGDGLLTALHTLAAVREQKKPFSKLVGWMKKFPQVLLNVPVKKRIPIPELSGVSSKIQRIEKILGTNGRVLVRYSGTEPLLRIMLEGPVKSKLQTYANEIAESVVRANR